MKEIISAISPLDRAAMEKCQERIDNLTKPLHSLEGFENLAVKLAGITKNPRPREFKASIILMAGDEGINEEIKTEGAKQRVFEACQGLCPIQVLAEHVLAKLTIVDIGTNADLAGLPILHKKIAYGTKNIRKGRAMTLAEARRAVEAGIQTAKHEIAKGSSVLGVGAVRAEDSLGSLAVIAQYSNKPLAELTGLADNKTNFTRIQETKLLEEALKVNAPRASDPFDVMSKVGSFEIAGLVGVILGAAAGKRAIVLDGLLASAAALLAADLAPKAKEYLIGSHLVPRPAHKEALERLKLPAYLQHNLTLGQGVGAALGISLLRASLHMLNDMKTFNEAKVAVAEDGPGSLKQKA